MAVLYVFSQELFYEHLEYYKIIGILCGLAIYNSVTVYLPFPMALYKKLLAKYVCMHRMVQTTLLCRVSLLMFEIFLFSLLSLHVVIGFIFRSPSFKDFMQLFPSMAKSIEEILQYSGNNFEEVFDLNFTVNKDCQCRSTLLSVIYTVQGILEELRACALLQLILLTMTEVVTIM